MSEPVHLPEVGDGGRAVLFEGEPRTVKLSLDAGERIPAHRHPERAVVIHVLSGALDLDLDEETLELAAGDVARFDGDRDISPAAREDSVALLVLAGR